MYMTVSRTRWTKETLFGMSSPIRLGLGGKEGSQIVSFSEKLIKEPIRATAAK
jgi:hypothetical protein